MGGGRRVFWKNIYGIFIENGTGICLIVSPHPSLSIYFWRTFMHRINKTKTDVYYLIYTYYIVVPPNIDVEYGIGLRLPSIIIQVEKFFWIKRDRCAFCIHCTLVIYFSFSFASYLIKRFLTFTTDKISWSNMNTNREFTQFIAIHWIQTY